jgi:hypothetical protein
VFADQIDPSRSHRTEFRVPAEQFCKVRHF